MFRLENWHISNMFGSEIAFGEVYNNPKFEDGTWIHTSSITEKDFENKIIRTLNSTYKLGEEQK